MRLIAYALTGVLEGHITGPKLMKGSVSYKQRTIIKKRKEWTYHQSETGA